MNTPAVWSSNIIRNFERILEWSDCVIIMCDINSQEYDFYKKNPSIEILEKSDHIKIILIDNGIGFNKANNIREILNPYYTTKKNGTGLGLSIVNKIINDHNGKIEFIAINDGAKINITFNLNDS